MDDGQFLTRYFELTRQVKDYLDGYMVKYSVTAGDIADKLAPRFGMKREVVRGYVAELRNGKGHKFLGNGLGDDAKRLWRLGVLFDVLQVPSSERIITRLTVAYAPLFVYPPGDAPIEPVEIVKNEGGQADGLEGKVKLLNDSDRKTIERLVDSMLDSYKLKE